MCCVEHSESNVRKHWENVLDYSLYFLIFGLKRKSIKERKFKKNILGQG